MRKPKVLRSLKKKIKLLMKVEKKLKNAWDIEHDKSKKKNIEKRALALTKKIDRLQAFADQILKR